MRTRLAMTAWLWGCTFVLAGCTAAVKDGDAPPAREQRVAAGSASLYVREVGEGPAILVLHGGPDFDHGYLLPDMDRLADAYRLVYYDQRGRGRSAQGVDADDVSLASEVADIEHLRTQLGLGKFVLLGHSWGSTLALEYALRHPGRVSRLVLMNPAPVSATGIAAVRGEYLRRLGDDMERQRAIIDGDAYRAGDPEAVAARYRIHFRPAVHAAADYERLMATMREGFLAQGSAGILLARRVEDRLFRETWNMEGYDLSPRLRGLSVPTLVIAGSRDFMAGAADRIARDIPGAKLVALRDCGHFAYLECPEQARAAIDAFTAGRR